MPAEVSDFFLYVLTPESLTPVERGDKYEDPIHECLAELGLGETTGGGSQLGNLRPDGTRGIEFCGIDIELGDLERGREVLRACLLDLGAPHGTELHFTVDGVKLKDRLTADGWALNLRRRLLHPGFGV